MSWYVIITASGQLLRAENGAPVLLPSIAEARHWMAPTDRGVVLWDGAERVPAVQYHDGDWQIAGGRAEQG